MCYEGLIPVTVRPPNLLNLATTLPTVRMVVEVSKAVAVLSTAFIIRVLRSKVTSLSLVFSDGTVHVCLIVAAENGDVLFVGTASKFSFYLLTFI